MIYQLGARHWDTERGLVTMQVTTLWHTGLAWCLCEQMMVSV